MRTESYSFGNAVVLSCAVCTSTYTACGPTYENAALSQHICTSIHNIVYTKILEVNLFGFAYRLFHEDFSSIDIAHT